MMIFAYIGPGAGFAVMGSFLIFFGALLLGLLILLSMPFRLLISLFLKKAKGRFRKVVIVGLDGVDPRRAKRLMDEGKLPNLKSMADTGHFSPLGSTCPPISPVAWSTFATGVNPGKHQIYDFLTRDFNTYLPLLSSTNITADRSGRSSVTLLRKSRPFWSILGENRVSCTSLRMPISFPPEPFKGRSLSAMCTPDLRGTQGEFTAFTEKENRGIPFTGLTTTSCMSMIVNCPPKAQYMETSPLKGIPLKENISKTIGGKRVKAEISAGCAESIFPGPVISGSELTLPLKLTWKPGKASKASLKISGSTYRLKVGEYTPWIELTFKQGRTKVHGIVRFLLKEIEPEFILYATPLNLNPAKPSMPIAWPKPFSVYLSKLQGLFATLGLAEDTWGLSEDVLSDDDFETQARSIHAEREKMFFESLKLIRRGFLVCVFDITDRMQHMFMRKDKNAGYDNMQEVEKGASKRIDKIYSDCDQMVGRVMKKLGKKDLLMVLSDHGFSPFRRCVHVNAWLRENGYLLEKPESERKDDSDYFANVDWSKTRVYSFGLIGVYINLKGRESQGVVEPGAEADALIQEIKEKLEKLMDPTTGKEVVRTVYEGSKVYHGPYTRRAPDLVMGWKRGYRHSWDTAVGATSGEIFEDNDNKWCGDHCLDRLEVPGVLFCNRKISWEDHPPHLADFAPSVLKLWNIKIPKYMDGDAWSID